MCIRDSYKSIRVNALTFALNLFETGFKTFKIEAVTPVVPILLKNGAKRTRTADPLHAMDVGRFVRLLATATKSPVILRGFRE